MEQDSHILFNLHPNSSEVLKRLVSALSMIIMEAYENKVNTDTIFVCCNFLFQYLGLDFKEYQYTQKHCYMRNIYDILIITILGN